MKRIRQVLMGLLITFVLVGCMDDGQDDIIEDGDVTEASLIGKWKYAGFRIEYYINGVLDDVEEGNENGDDGEYSITFNSNKTYKVIDGDYTSEGTYAFENGKLMITYTEEVDLNGDGEVETVTYTEEVDAFFEAGKLVFKYEDPLSPPGSADEHLEVGYEYFEKVS
ncbi:hypothetical protein ACFSKL_17885 [Belliella marina]|uniref:Lipocalin-like domain-containing protein n=1 Tax=Belliella marina TaxID=1644146 RepID=A0ABW4VSU3_9BACT